MFKRCLICTDFSDGLDRLVNFVPNLAQGGLEQIVFLHSVPLWEEGEIPRIDKDGIKKAEARLSKALENVPEGVEVHVEVPSGRPTDMIPQALKKYRSEVILTGTPIRSLLQEKLFGSTTQGLAKLVKTPLMTLRPELISTYTCEELALRCQHLWRYLLIPYNDSESARYLIKQIKEYANQAPADSFQRCLLCWVIGDSGSRRITIDYLLKEAEGKLKSVQAELEELGLQVDIEVSQGNALHKVLDLALNKDISAIAIGNVSSGNIFEWTVPSFANEVLRRSWFPVVCFSPKE